MSSYIWALTQNVELREDIEDKIAWKLTANGEYSAKSAYEVQFLGSTACPMYKSVWKAWAPPKVKFFAWLATKNRIWTADRLAKRGWPNCGPCPLCKQTTESVDPLFVSCRMVKRIWGGVNEWIGIPGMDISQWEGLSLKAWWGIMTNGQISNRKAMISLTLLVTGEIWNERNARVFNNEHSSSFVILDRIKREARMWVTAGGKRLGEIMPRE